METIIHFRSYLANFSSEWKMFQTKVVEKPETHVWYTITFFFPEKRVLYIMEKYCSEGQATDDNMAHAHCMLDT